MTDDMKKRQTQEHQSSEYRERKQCFDEAIIPRRVQNSMPHINDDDGTKETIRNRNSNIEES